MQSLGCISPSYTLLLIFLWNAVKYGTEKKKKKKKTESTLQMPQTFFLLTQPKAETLLIIQF